MNSLADALPPEIARQVHAEWRQNETAFWAIRDQIHGQYEDQWIAFANGAVIASGSKPLDVFLAIQQSHQHPFVVRVGHEDEPWYRIRRKSFSYDNANSSTALPIIEAEFRATRGSSGLLLDRVIPDTGADTTTLAWSDCQQMHLDPALVVPGAMSGVAGSVAATIGFLIWVSLDGQEYACQLQADFAGGERILGRDVLNCMDVLFRGPSGMIIISP